MDIINKSKDLSAEKKVQKKKGTPGTLGPDVEDRKVGVAEDSAEARR